MAGQNGIVLPTFSWFSSWWNPVLVQDMSPHEYFAQQLRRLAAGGVIMGDVHLQHGYATWIHMNSYDIPWKLRNTWQGKAANDPLVMVHHFDSLARTEGTNPLVGHCPGWKCSRETRPFVQVESVGLCWHRLDTSWCVDFSSFFYHVLRPKKVKVRCEHVIEKIYIKYQLYISYISAIYQLYISYVYISYT